ncbi:uncharacterized protein BKA78DRAFT_363196 [Phyllosticta capitalensis]|uniref:uncharacterized protein n=1 Tax=Phyllosticta capitalensis TaxID=121624 RepID=UPI0031306CBD
MSTCPPPQHRTILCQKETAGVRWTTSGDWRLVLRLCALFRRLERHSTLCISSLAARSAVLSGRRVDDRVAQMLVSTFLLFNQGALLFYIILRLRFSEFESALPAPESGKSGEGKSKIEASGEKNKVKTICHGIPVQCQMKEFNDAPGACGE